jgi:hypothetical protein
MRLTSANLRVFFAFPIEILLSKESFSKFKVTTNAYSILGYAKL